MNHGISRRNLLLASAAAAAFARSGRAKAGAAPPKYLVVVFAVGGWDVTYCLDSKLGKSTNIEGPELDPNNSHPKDEEVAEYAGGALKVGVNDGNRPAVRAFFDKWHHRTHVVNGIWTGSIAHAPCRLRMFTGTTSELSSDVPTIFGYEKGTDLEPLGTVDLSGLSYPGSLAATSGRIGFQSQIKALVDPESEWPAGGGMGPYPNFKADGAHRALVTGYLGRRAQAYQALRGDGGRNDELVAGLVESLDRSERFRAGGLPVMDSLVLGQTPRFDTQTAIAAQLLKDGLCRAVVLDTGSDWDTHISNASQIPFHESLFLGLDNLAVALEEAGIFEDTVVCVMSEMTRTPQFNASAGKDHWAYTSALFFGGPVRGDSTSGGTDDELLESLHMDLATGEVTDPANGAYCKYDNLAAGLLTMLGVDSREYFPDTDPFTGFMQT